MFARNSQLSWHVCFIKNVQKSGNLPKKMKNVDQNDSLINTGDSTFLIEIWKYLRWIFFFIPLFRSTKIWNFRDENKIEDILDINMSYSGGSFWKFCPFFDPLFFSIFVHFLSQSFFNFLIFCETFENFFILLPKKLIFWTRKFQEIFDFLELEKFIFFKSWLLNIFCQTL